MNLPINGRIAIIDDQIKHALPLIQVLSKNRLPHSYYSGDLLFLPNEDIDKDNDVRLLFLDINLIDNGEHENKVLKSRLIPVINRVISENNYPYIIVYWSRHEHHKALIEDDIFTNELVRKKPIGYISADKSSFFDLEGNNSEDFDDKIEELFTNINTKFEDYKSYQILLEWENQVHNSADKTLQNIFSPYHQFENWTNNSNYIINKLGKAYLGNYFEGSNPEDKIKASLVSFNSIFKDTVENNVYNLKIESPVDLVYTNDETNKDLIISTINEKLNLSKDIKSLSESGNIILYNEKEEIFSALLHRLFSLFKIKSSIKEKSEEEIDEAILKKIADTEFKTIRRDIKKSWKKISVVVTPVCDFVQKNNNIYDRVVKGVLIPKDYQQYIDDKSEAIFICPFSINYDNIDFVLVLDFRYFITTELAKENNISPIYRIRQELLAEIQSRLARHINRQGILFLD
ncbi:hypothetical protein [Flavobacterium olei]|uniref:hypothetical protein n=1 Tax=Flavobacterium olei TaxID=1886782 RepID=UPI0032196E5A